MYILIYRKREDELLLALEGVVKRCQELEEVCNNSNGDSLTKQQDNDHDGSISNSMDGYNNYSRLRSIPAITNGGPSNSTGRSNSIVSRRNSSYR